MSPEFAAIIVAVIACIGSVFVGLSNSKKLSEVHIIVNNRYTELQKVAENAAAEVKFLTKALANANLISLQDHAAKIETFKNGGDL